MKYSIGNISLLIIIVAVLGFLQVGEVTLFQRNLAGGLCLLIGILYLAKIYTSYKKGRISTALPILNWGARFSTRNNFIGDTFERSADPKKFNSALRASAYIAIIFLGFGLLVLMSII